MQKTGEAAPRLLRLSRTLNKENLTKPATTTARGVPFRIMTRRQSPYEVDVHASGVPTQAVTLLQPLANWLPMFVFLIATQKTKATRTTIRVYSTKPWPSSSTKRRFRSSMNHSPPSHFELVNSLHQAYGAGLEQIICQARETHILAQLRYLTDNFSPPA